MMEYRNHESLPVLKSKEYAKHVQAMTAEDLYGKGEIAEELAFRDIRISALEAELAAAQERAETLESVLRDERENAKITTARVDQDRADAERIDWILANCDNLWCVTTHEQLPEMSRAAIDAARAIQKESEDGK